MKMVGFLNFCFNTQPPEGGWIRTDYKLSKLWGFNTQPPEGGWARERKPELTGYQFQHTAA